MKNRFKLDVNQKRKSKEKSYKFEFRFKANRKIKITFFSKICKIQSTVKTLKKFLIHDKLEN